MLELNRGEEKNALSEKESVKEDESLNKLDKARVQRSDLLETTRRSRRDVRCARAVSESCVSGG